MKLRLSINLSLVRITSNGVNKRVVQLHGSSYLIGKPIYLALLNSRARVRIQHDILLRRLRHSIFNIYL